MVKKTEPLVKKGSTRFFWGEGSVERRREGPRVAC